MVLENRARSKTQCKYCALAGSRKLREQQVIFIFFWAAGAGTFVTVIVKSHGLDYER